MKKQQIFLIGILIFSCIVLSLTSPFFLTWKNIVNILNQSSLNIIVAIGMCFVICSKGIDLSVGSTAALSGAVMALLLKQDFSVAFSISMGFLTGVAVGVFNGALISEIKLNPFIVTLASMSVMRALTLIITKSIPIYGFPKSFLLFGSGFLYSIPVPVIITIVISLVGLFLLNATKFGYYTLALGGNEEALRRNGVFVKLYKILIYGFSGFTAGVAGLILTARLNSADPLAGSMMELDVIATVILGGTSINGGRGTIVGTVAAGIFLAVIRNGLTINNIPSYYQQLAVGMIILLAVIISERREINQI